MKRTRSFFAAALVASTLAASPASAQHAAKPSVEAREAGRHFQRGVALFNEADYAGALAEFKRAHELAPNAAVLYNIGQTHFQLRSYAAALHAFERYLSEAGASAEHRAEAEANVETLRARVGKIDVLAPEGTEVSIDDEVVGKTPLAPVLAAVGRRKVTLFKEGNQQVRFAEVAAGETARVELRAVAGSAAVVGPAVSRAPQQAPAPTAERTSSALPVVLWVSAGVLAAGAATTGVLALRASSDLSGERAKAAGGTSRRALDDLEAKTSTLALVTDVLAGAAVVTGVVALYVTVTSGSSRTAVLRSPARAGLDLHVGPARFVLEGRF